MLNMMIITLQITKTTIIIEVEEGALIEAEEEEIEAVETEAETTEDIKDIIMMTMCKKDIIIKTKRQTKEAISKTITKSEEENTEAEEDTTSQEGRQLKAL